MNIPYKYTWTAENLNHCLLKKITTPTVKSEHSQLSNNLELLNICSQLMFTSTALWYNGGLACFNPISHQEDEGKLLNN